MRIRIRGRMFREVLPGIWPIPSETSCTGELVRLASGESTLFEGRLLRVSLGEEGLELVLEVQELE